LPVIFWSPGTTSHGLSQLVGIEPEKKCELFEMLARIACNF